MQLFGIQKSRTGKDMGKVSLKTIWTQEGDISNLTTKTVSFSPWESIRILLRDY